MEWLGPCVILKAGVSDILTSHDAIVAVILAVISMRASTFGSPLWIHHTKSRHIFMVVSKWPRPVMTVLLRMRKHIATGPVSK